MNLDLLIDNINSGLPTNQVLETVLKEDASSTWNNLKDSERYAKLFMLFPRSSINILGKLSKQQFINLPPDIRRAILTYYSN